MEDNKDYTIERKLFSEEQRKNVHDVSISNELENCFIDYAMSVIVARAIPDSRDGLKPVHRRILYAMATMEMFHNKPFKKSARVVGEVIAKYHPHGDAAVYDTLVRMAQTFSLRYPLVLGQGNFGSIDGDSAAAMRYTEVKLHKISNYLMEDINKNTVDFNSNYDETEREPIVLPSLIPNLLINGSTGIAVGMATSIPPHNLSEVINSLFQYSKKIVNNEEQNIDDLLMYIKGPDFPTGGMIINKNDISEIYKTGKGRVVVRGITNIEFDEKKNSGKIIITEIPYMVNKANLILKIAHLVKSESIESIRDIRDESNRKGIRIVIELKRGFIPNVELNKLFKLTPLQSSFSVNLLALKNGAPKVLNLKEVFEIYYEHQKEILVRKTNFLLDKSKKRKHILEGLDIALKNIDAVIEIIKKSKDNKEAINQLEQTFSLSEKQSKAILDMKLQRLTGLEIKNLQEEIETINKNIIDYENTLSSEVVQIKKINTKLEEIKTLFGDERRTQINEKHITNINEEDLIPKENVVITISKRGYIKRLSTEEYKQQRRGGIGVRGIKTNEDDFVYKVRIANTHTDLLVFTSEGKVYRTRVHQIPELGKGAKGLPIINLLDIPKNEKVLEVITVDSYENKDFIFYTQKGIIKRTSAMEYQRINRNGKAAIVLKEKDLLIRVRVYEHEDEDVFVILGNSNGKVTKFNINELRTIGRNTSGVHGMNIGKGKVVSGTTSQNGSHILTISENGFGKLTEIDKYRTTHRGSKGVLSTKIETAGKIVYIDVVYGTEDIIVITDKGTIIRTSLSELSVTNRVTKGVKTINIRDGEKISSVAVMRFEEQKDQKELTEEIEL